MSTQPPPDPPTIPWPTVNRDVALPSLVIFSAGTVLLWLGVTDWIPAK